MITATTAVAFLLPIAKLNILLASCFTFSIVSSWLIVNISPIFSRLIVYFIRDMQFNSIMEKLKTALYLAYHRLQGALYSFTQLWKTEQYFTVCQSLRSFKEVLNQKKYLNVGLMSWSCGTALVIILLFLLTIS